MMKKFKVLFLSIFIMLGLASCIQTKPTAKYSFKDITNKEISDIISLSINYGPMMSSVNSFDGNYEKILDVEYILSDMPYNEVKNIQDDYRFHLFIDFNNYNIEMFVYEYKLYFFSSIFYMNH